jgi:hypothetical protein
MTVAIDLLDEDRSLALAMQRLATDHALRDELAQRGHQYWARHHTLELMAEDYRRLIPAAIERPVPIPADLPAHFTEDYSEAGRRIARRFGADVDILRQ